MAVNGYGAELDRNGYAPSIVQEDRCHQHGPNSVHQNAEANRALKVRGQRAAMEKYGWSKEDFIREFGKSYLED